jgi:hypothetical protein
MGESLPIRFPDDPSLSLRLIGLWPIKAGAWEGESMPPPLGGGAEYTQQTQTASLRPVS